MDMEAAGFIDIDSLDVTEKLKHLIDLRQIGYSPQDRAGEFDAASGMTLSSNRSIFLEMPGFPVIFYGYPVILDKIEHVSPVFGSRGNIVRFNDSIICRYGNILQPEKFDLHAKGAVREVLQHGVTGF